MHPEMITDMLARQCQATQLLRQWFSLGVAKGYEYAMEYPTLTAATRQSLDMSRGFAKGLALKAETMGVVVYDRVKAGRDPETGEWKSETEM